MNAFFLGILLWIPFVIVMTATLIMFLLSGYKRGLWRSLISLGVTAISAGLSLLLSKLIAHPVAGLIMENIPAEDMDLPFSPEFVTQLVQGLVGVTISLLLFSVLMLMFCLIGKTLSNYLGDDKLMPKSTGMKWAGLGIRLIDAVVFSLLILLPLYGTLATYTPVVQTAISYVDEQTEDVEALMDAVTEHPVVTASQDGPVGWVYDGLAEAQIGDNSLDIAGMADSVSGLMEKVEALENASEETAVPRALELIDYLRSDVVDEDWCYELVIEQSLPEMRTMLLEDATENERIMVEKLLELCDMSQKDFRKNSHAILDFMEYLLENDQVEIDLEDAMESKEFLEEFGKLINASWQAAGLKKMMIRICQVQILDLDPIEVFSGEMLAEPVDEDDYVQDALAFLMILEARTPEELAEGIRMMPTTSDPEDPFKYFRF